MTPVPYLYFNGSCEAALSAYARIFGGEITALMRMKDMPDPAIPQSAAEMVMHATLTLPNGALIMASDNFRGDSAETSNISLTMNFDTVEAAKAAFDALADGAEIQQDFGPQFWTDGFGALKDRFHIRWQISAPQKAF
ncbi:hypothetical protein AQS8620_03184 [Aquimixticola soesokkakensis]|uniref:PhnB-like domain-containing protein n=1 Tax=Aquimixticola soesokkakensis TaxID=1519096 RepID=A0A1Y5TMY6_9RHOB|nr:glyoxalase/bleomycin resistance/extradiol dioxygenase family protein [Aquimixticola soesokkakensis]SLN67796.1 hypothetical protein AQS8620_03184 [Aquimixticola soesokkakensis]